MQVKDKSGNRTSAELPEMNNVVQLQLPRRLRLLNCFTVGRLQLARQLHCWTASLLTAFSKEVEWTKMHNWQLNEMQVQASSNETTWNASADIFKWNNLECKCRHLQMKQLGKPSKVKWKAFHISDFHSTSFTPMSSSELPASAGRFARVNIFHRIHFESKGQQRQLQNHQRQHHQHDTFSNAEQLSISRSSNSVASGASFATLPSAMASRCPQHQGCNSDSCRKRTYYDMLRITCGEFGSQVLFPNDSSVGL